MVYGLSLLKRFTDKDLSDLFYVMDTAAAVELAPISSDGHHYHHQHPHQHYHNYNSYSSYNQQQLTRLQDEILRCLEVLERETLLFDLNTSDASSDGGVGGSGSVLGGTKKNLLQPSQQQQLLVQRFICPLFDQLLKFCRFVCPSSPTSTAQYLQIDQQLNGVTNQVMDHNKVCKLFIPLKNLQS